MDKKMSAEEVAGLLGIGERQLRTYVKDFGLPVQTVGRDRVFVWPEVLAWYLEWKIARKTGPALARSSADEEDGEDIRTATARKVRAEANLKELALSRMRGEVVVVADVKDRLDRVMGGLRTKLLGLSGRLSARMQSAVDREELENLFREELEMICGDLHTAIVLETPSASVEDDEEDSAESIEASASDAEPQTNRAGITNDELLLNMAELLEEYSGGLVE